MRSARPANRRQRNRLATPLNAHPLHSSHMQQNVLMADPYFDQKK